MILTDTHTHLYSEEFSAERDAMMQRAFAAGVHRLFVPSIDSTYTQQMLDMEAQYPGHVFLMMGLHPCYVKPDSYEKELEWVYQQLQMHRYYAVGEIGIDLYWDKTTLALQQDAFRQQVRWAKSMKLPVNIHCRDAFDEVFEVLESEHSADLFGIFHCFTGDFDQAKRAIALGMKLGIGGVVTFKNGKIDQYINQIALDHIVIETDAPYLAPVPFRGKRNESSYALLVAQKLAAIYGCSLEEIASITTQNSKNIFGI